MNKKQIKITKTNNELRYAFVDLYNRKNVFVGPYEFDILNLEVFKPGSILKLKCEVEETERGPKLKTELNFTYPEFDVILIGGIK